MSDTKQAHILLPTLGGIRDQAAGVGRAEDLHHAPPAAFADVSFAAIPLDDAEASCLPASSTTSSDAGEGADAIARPLHAHH